MHSLGVLAIQWDGDVHGPEMLRSLASTTRSAIRVTDLVFRHGESQLVVLIPDWDLDTGHVIAERVLTNAVPTVDPVAAGLRIGFACAPADGDTLTELVQAAQSRLRQRRTAATLTVAPRQSDSDGLASPRAVPA
jgi:diguanylate cyclase (GGDEF)-like protein